jgi:hypothetical protein
MRTREKGFFEYGFQPGEEKEIKALCRKRDFKTVTTLLLAAYKAYPELAYALAFSLHYGVSYRRVCEICNLPILQEDFYGYRRKTLFYFRDLYRLTK